MLFLHKILNGIWFIDRQTAENYIPLVTSHINGQPLMAAASSKARSGITLSTFRGSAIRELAYDPNQEYAGSETEFIRAAPENSILTICLTDAITKYDQACGPRGMNSLSNYLRAAYATPNITGVVLKIDSGGGEGNAMRMFVETISERNKPVIAFIDDFAASAAYGIAAACDLVTANSTTARIGSIGCYMTVADYTGQLAKEGIKLTEIYARQSTEKNKDYMDAIAGDTKAVEDIATIYCESFLAQVEKDRAGKLTAEREVWGTGRMFFATEAMELGLIDNIDTYQNFLNYFNV